MTRRQVLGGLIAALTGVLGPCRALASPRPRYGGQLRLTLPLDTSRLDPHDESSLATRLLGGSLFDGLYARHAAAGIELAYPTLAAAAPKRRGSVVTIELRPALRSGRGAKLDARAVATSLERSRLRSSILYEVRQIRASAPLELELTTELGESELALRLASPSSAIVPPNFDPAWPDCTGALRSVGPGIGRLIRNGWAPRGGSYLAEVQLKSADLRTCLRDFETRTSELGFLGSGLHQRRGSARQFALGPLGWLVLVPGARLGRFAAPGVLQQALGALRPVDFSALGVQLTSGVSETGWSGPPCSILVDESEPWLVMIAAELARAWDSPRARVRSEPVRKGELDLRRKDGNFDCALSFLGADDERHAQSALLALSRLPPPRTPLGTVTLEDAVRHLPLALLGRLAPHGYFDPRLTDLVIRAAFDLANARFSS